jgi:hypothetical protein
MICNDVFWWLLNFGEALILGSAFEIPILSFLRLDVRIASRRWMATLPAAAGASDDDALRKQPLGSFVEATRLEQLSNMVVTDTKGAQSPDSVTRRIVVLRSEVIARQPDVNRNLAELLRHTSGQFVNVLSRNDANWGFCAVLGPKYNS